MLISERRILIIRTLLEVGRFIAKVVSATILAVGVLSKLLELVVFDIIPHVLQRYENYDNLFQFYNEYLFPAGEVNEYLQKLLLVAGVVSIGILALSWYALIKVEVEKPNYQVNVTQVNNVNPLDK